MAESQKAEGSGGPQGMVAGDYCAQVHALQRTNQMQRGRVDWARLGAGRWLMN